MPPAAGVRLADLHGAGFQLTHETLQPISLSLDLRATQAVRDELVKGIEHFRAKAGGAAIMDVNTGEMIAYASLPDYDPNNPVDALDPNHINRLNVGVYEMGSTFKAISIAMALEAALDGVVRQRGLPALEVVLPDERVLVGEGPAAASVTLDRFEWMRAFGGRRSVDQIRALAWTGDPAPYLAVFEASPLSPPAEPLEE